MRKQLYAAHSADKDSIMEAKLKKRNDQDDVLLMAKRARQERDRAAVRSGVRTPDSMLTFDQEQVRATFVVRRRSVNY